MKPKNGKYRFYVGHILPGIQNQGYGWREVFPIQTQALRIVSEQESGQIFFRRKLSGNIVLIDGDQCSDYSYIKNIQNNIYPFVTDSLYDFKIDKLCNGVWKEFWHGEFTLYNCFFDEDNCKVEIEVNVKDQYNCLLKKKEQKFNLFDITNIYSCISENLVFNIETTPTNSDVKNCHGFLDFYAGGVPYFVPYNSVNDGTGGTDYTPYDAIYTWNNLYSDGWAVVRYKWEEIDQASEYYNLDLTWARQVTSTLDIGGNPNPPLGNWQLVSATTINGQAATKWVNLDFQTNVAAVAPTTSFLSWVPKTFQWTWAYYNGQYTYYDRNRTFIDAIKQITNSCILNFQSIFFTDSVNYVTGLVNGIGNRVQNLLIAGKNDIMTPSSTYPQTQAYYTFNDIETWLKEMFNCYWFIDTNNTFRIEHISWFKTGQQLGINLQALEGGRYIKSSNKYEYTSPKQYSKERWTFMEKSGQDFVGTDIVYPYSVLVSEQDAYLAHNVPNVTTDVGIIKASPGSISIEGFVIMACYVNGSGILEVINETGEWSGLIIENGHLSVANLQQNYFRHWRIKIQGTMNNVFQTFLSAEKVKQQKPVTFPVCCDNIIDETKLIRTNMGDGEVTDAEYDLIKEMQTVSLIY